MGRPIDTAQETKMRWDNKPNLNQYTKGYLEKECVDWLNKFREYGDQELRNGSPPDVHVFAKRYIRYKTKMKLTCLATGFYHKDVMLNIRKYGTSLPEDEMKSTGIRPNHDGSFQMRKSVEIKEEEKDEYDCFMTPFKGSIIIKLDGKYWDCPPETVSLMIGVVVGVVLMLALDALVVYILVKKKIIGQASETSDSSATVSLDQANENDNLTNPQQEISTDPLRRELLENPNL